MSDPQDPTIGLDTEARRTAEAFAEIGRRLAAYGDSRTAIQALVDVAAEVVPGARWASVTRGRDDHFTTMASTDPIARRADQLQYQLGTGPCIDAVVDESVFASNDLALEDRWSPFGPIAARDIGTRGVLSVRLALDHDADVVLNAGLNIYADRIDAFDADSRFVAMLLATHASVAVSGVLGREQARQMKDALESNREIGVAMGVLMARMQLTRGQAFDLLRIASQNRNRKLHDLAVEVADTGVLDLPPAHPQR